MYPLALKQLFQLAVLALQLSDSLLELVCLRSVRVSVDDWFILDIHCFAGVLNGIETLLIVGFTRTHASYHVGVGVPSQAILQDSGQFGVPIRDELRLFLLNG